MEISYKRAFWILFVLALLAVTDLARAVSFERHRCRCLRIELAEALRDARYYRAQMVLADAMLRRAEGRPFADDQVHEALENLRKLDGADFDE